MFLQSSCKICKKAHLSRNSIFFVKSVLKKVITRATPGRSLVGNKQVKRALINFFYQCITIFFRANSIVLKHPLYSKGFSSLKRLLFNPLQTEKGKLWSRHKSLLYPYSSNFHFSVKKRYVFPCLAFTSTSKRACSWNVALLSFPLTPFSHWQQKLCVWKMLP